MTTLTRAIIAFIITGAIFVTAFLASDFFNTKRIESLRSIQDNIAINILSLETQYDLLSLISCESISENPILSKELLELGDKLAFMEESRGRDDEEVIRLKKYYSLLEVKDILLMSKITQKCGLKPISILYFYSNEGDCEDCEKQGLVLTEFRKNNPELRLYSFDYNIDLPVIKTLAEQKGLSGKLPAIVIDKKVLEGFNAEDDLNKILPNKQNK